MLARDVLLKLCAATPAPPLGVSLEALLEAFHQMADARQTILDEVQVPTPATSTEERELLDELRAREAVWEAALTAARTRIGDHRIHASRLRAYAATDDAVSADEPPADPAFDPDHGAPLEPPVDRPAEPPADHAHEG